MLCEYCGKEIKEEWRKSRKVKRRLIRFCSERCARGFSSEEKREEINRKVSGKLRKKRSFCKDCNKELDKRNKTGFCFSCYKNHHSKKPINNLQDYRNKCRFGFALSDYPKEFDFSLIEKYGWYSASNRGNNLQGVSRDHILSVKYGWENKVDSAIVKHPANCQLMPHNKNVSKHSKSSLSLEELKIKISLWEEKYGRVV